MKRKIIYAVVIIGIIVVGFFIFRLLSSRKQVIQIETEKVGRATISNTVTATGTIKASITVEVGTQVSGKINKLYVDYNSVVKKNQLLAVLDTESLESTLEQSKATLDQAQAEYEYQKANFERYEQLIKKKLIAQTDFDQVEYNYKSANASLNSAKASYAKNKTNLDYAYIYSPIDGVVLERDVEEGETVAASFETPTLFTIANDLTQMKIEADVDEADIGQVKMDQRVEFTVDAFPDKTFNGKVTEIRMNPDEDASVVTYTVVIDAPNPDKILMPGMTASAVFYVTEKKDIVVVPNKALQFTPDEASLRTYQEAHPEVSVKMPSESSGSNPDTGKTVWVKTANSIYPQTVVVGETDEINYEVLSGINEGTDVIVSMTSVKGTIAGTNSEESAKSPFMPTPPGRNNKKK